MTKKSFIEQVDYHNYGRGNGKIALFYDWKGGDISKNEHWRGFKWMVCCDKSESTKKELIDIFYQWVNEKIDQVPYWVTYKFAINDNDRFKVPICL